MNNQQPVVVKPSLWWFLSWENKTVGLCCSSKFNINDADIKFYMEEAIFDNSNWE